MVDYPIIFMVDYPGVDYPIIFMDHWIKIIGGSLMVDCPIIFMVDWQDQWLIIIGVGCEHCLFLIMEVDISIFNHGFSC